MHLLVGNSDIKRENKMQIIIRIIIPAIIPIALGMLLSNIDKSNSKELINNLTNEYIIIRMPKAYMWIGCLDISFFVTCLVLMACFPNGTVTPWVRVLFCLFALLGVAIVLVTTIWKIEIFRHADYFFLRTVALRTRKIQYCECITFKLGTNFLTLKTSKGTFHIACKATNFAFLMAMLIQHKVKGIQEFPNT